MSTTVGPAGQHAVLDPQMGLVAHDVVDRAVPAIDRAVVETQLGEPGRVAALERLQRILVVADRQERREVADVLLEQVEDRGDPALAEPHPGAYALDLELLRTGVGGLLEQRDTGLPPQLLAAEERRVGRHRHLYAGDRLGRVPVPGEGLGLDLLVELHAGAGRLGRDRVGVGGEALDPADRDLEILAPRGEDLLVEQRVAGVGAEHLGPKMLGVDRRQDPDDHHVRADRAGPLLGVVETGPRVALELGEHSALQQPRLDVDLDVELPELGLEARVGDRLERGGVDQGRLARVVRQVELDLQPERASLRVKARFREHPGEHVETGPDLTPVTLAILAAEGPGGDLLAHSHSIRERARGYNRGPSEFG